MRFVIFLLATILYAEYSASQTIDNLARQAPAFVENKGQLSGTDGKPASGVWYYMTTPALDFFITDNGISYVFKDAVTGSKPDDAPRKESDPDPVVAVNWHRVDVSPEGGHLNRLNTEIVYAKNAAGLTWYNQHAPEGISAQRIQSVTIKDVYPGIDWQFVAENDHLKYNFILHPGADIKQIRLLFKGMDNLAFENNQLVISTSLGSLVEKEVVSFTSDGRPAAIQPKLDQHTLSYEALALPELQKDQTLIIDPPLVWATYYGGSIDDLAIVMERNSNGFIFVLVQTTSNDFPVLDPAPASSLNYYNGTYSASYDVGIVKFTENGVQNWSTYYGGSGNDVPTNLFYNGSVLLIVGYTNSSNFPLENFTGGFYDNTLDGASDGFIAGFVPSPVGETRIWSTYFGGTSNDEITDCTMKGSRLIVAGHTNSTDLPVQNNTGAYFDGTNTALEWDIFLTEFDAMTTLITWSTYYGGPTNIEQYPYIDIDSTGRLMVSCQTLSSDFPTSSTLPGCYSQAFAGGTDFGLAMFNTSRSLIWGTYLGSAGNEWANDLICDYNNRWILVGNSNHAAFPVVNTLGGNFYQTVKGTGSDAVLVKFGSNGEMLYSSFYGGNNNDAAYGVTIDSHKNLYMVGDASSTNLATFDPMDGSYYDATSNGGSDEFLIELDSNFNKKWITYLGGASNDRLMDVRVSPSDHVFAVGWTNSAAHPTQNLTGAYFDNARGGTRDAVIMKFIPCPEDFNTIHYTDSVCFGEQTLLYGTGSDTYTWNIGSTNDSIAPVIVSDTSFSVISTYLTCIERDTVQIVVKPLPVISFSGDSSVCLNDTMMLSATGGVLFSWETGETNDTLSFVPAASGYLSISVTNAYLCTADDSVAITVFPLPTPSVAGPVEVCRLDTITVTASGGSSFQWNTSESTAGIDISWPATGTYDYWVIATDANGCSDTAFHQVDVLALPEFWLGNDTTICFGTSIPLNTGIAGASYTWNTGAITPSITVSTAQQYIAQVTDANNCRWSDSILIGVQPLPVIVFGGDSAICFGDSVHLSASGGVVFSWENGMSGSNISFVPAASDIIAVTVTDAFSCTATDSIPYVVMPLPVPLITGDSVVCRNDTATWTANGGVSYVWSNTWTGPTVTVPLQVQGTHQYYVIATDINGCSDTAFHSVLVHPLPEFTLGNDTTLCQGNSLVMNIGVAPATYDWNTGDHTQSISTGTAGTYTAMATDANTCMWIDTIVIAVIPWSDATITDISYVCENSTPFLFAAAEPGGVWSGTGITSSNGNFSASAAGVGFHTIYYNIAGLCGDSDSSVIEVADAPEATFTSTDETCLGASDGTLELMVSGGQSPYVYLLDSVYIALSNSNLSPGAFLLSVVDNRGCLFTDSVYILAEDFPCGAVDLYIPNIFSPNGDGQNDILLVRSNFIVSMRLVVYDRFGEKVFESRDIASGWDGKYQGQPVADGVYYYHISASLVDGSNIDRKGNVTLVR